jgi:hypothetical protein
MSKYLRLSGHMIKCLLTELGWAGLAGKIFVSRNKSNAALLMIMMITSNYFCFSLEKYYLIDVPAYYVLSGHPGLDVDVGQFLDSLQLNNLKDIFEREQVRYLVVKY